MIRLAPTSPLKLRRWSRVMLRASLALMTAFLLAGCPPPETTPGRTSGPVFPPPPTAGTPVPEKLPVMGPPVVRVPQEPDLRIRILAGAQSIDVNANSALLIGPVGGSGQTVAFTPPVNITRGKDGFILHPRAGQSMAWPAAALQITPQSGGSIAMGKSNYPHDLVLYGIGTASAGGNSFDVVNHTPLEEYLPGVLDKELYKTWSAQTFLAQAIAARSYAIFSANRSAKRTFDLESNVTSQMYTGAVNNPVANSAVQQTRGLVLTWDKQVLPAYYSAATGGTGQDAVIAFADAADIPPLRGRKQDNYESACPNYRWGPITRGRVELSRRFADWGRENKHAVAGIGDIASIVVSAQNGAGRPAQFTVTDSAGKKFVLMAEEFRFACNNETPGQPRLTLAQSLKSSHVTVQVTHASVVFSDGHGFGHGVGLSQWGAQGMAQRGFDFRKILAYYYPGAEVTRAYK